MEKLAERIGLFEFWAVFFPGSLAVLEGIFYIGTFMCIYLKSSFLSTIKSFYPNGMFGWIAVVILSMLLGHVLPEIGRLLRLITKSQNATSNFLDTKAHVFNDTEISGFKEYLISYGWNEKDTSASRYIFNRINAAAQDCEVASKYVKLSVLQNMSLSISSAMVVGALLSVACFIYSIANGRCRIAVLLAVVTAVCTVLASVFWGRYKRFNRYWVRNIVYAMSERYDRGSKK